MANLELGANPANLKWRAPTENVDGTPIQGPLNYNLYRSDSEPVSKASGVFFVLVGTLQADGTYEAPLGQFPGGRNVIAITAVDAEGDESELSNDAGFYISDGVAPRPPVLIA